MHSVGVSTIHAPVYGKTFRHTYGPAFRCKYGSMYMHAWILWEHAVVPSRTLYPRSCLSEWNRLLLWISLCHAVSLSQRRRSQPSRLRTRRRKTFRPRPPVSGALCHPGCLLLRSLEDSVTGSVASSPLFGRPPAVCQWTTVVSLIQAERRLCTRCTVTRMPGSSSYVWAFGVMLLSGGLSFHYGLRAVPVREPNSFPSPPPFNR